ncbi:MAG: CPBP family intramembrane metalloprotease [Leptolyngbya sp. SIO1E4]|nr:CPBP family intramembrane metalloprotease [Leptolyngbya sp. SIO1E4]
MLAKAKVLLTVLSFLVVWGAVWAAIAFPIFRKFNWRPFTILSPEKKLALLFPLYLLAPLMVWGANAFLGQSWSTIGLILTVKTVRSLIYGWGIAIVGLLLLLLLKTTLRLVTAKTGDDPTPPERTPPQSLLTLLGLLVLALWIGGIEELVFRGWIQTQLEITFIPWIAATISSTLFAMAHLIWDGRPGLWQQPGLWILGWVLVIARWADGGSLALAWGLHAGWVWGLACMGKFLQLQPADQKPTWLVGLPDQPLTSVLDLALMGATAGLVWWSWLA